MLEGLHLVRQLNCNGATRKQVTHQGHQFPEAVVPDRQERTLDGGSIQKSMAVLKE
ncbi:hypothetical protein BT69DRAFT_1289424 [Atractiella rhizophila]|nr:hypothetical protein BT69DRAFT_1290840 [Atractiella rhizophila]KAH8914977.1 hypothetical protein BT69DRAFT_1289424 [Atractiella rhizophila]